MANNNKFKVDPSLLLIGGGLALAYFGVIDPVLQFIGLKDTKEEKAAKAQQEAAVKSTMADVLKTQKPTLTQAQLSAIADVLFNSMRYSSISDDYETAGYYLAKCQNDADVLTLINMFGRRDECYFGVLCYNKTLPEMVNSNLSKNKIALVNDNYRRKGIKYRW